MQISPLTKFEISDRGSKMYMPKKFYKIRGSKMYIPKNFYAKTTYSPLLSKKFVRVSRPLPPPLCCALEYRMHFL
ncbi:hypothetical protein Hanom_Chr05g00457141 [Helianthus anomalus]